MAIHEVAILHYYKTLQIGILKVDPLIIDADGLSSRE